MQAQGLQYGNTRDQGRGISSKEKGTHVALPNGAQRVWLKWWLYIAY